jgi:hypothetical protein
MIDTSRDGSGQEGYYGLASSAALPQAVDWHVVCLTKA